MISAKFYESLIDCVRDDIMVVGAGQQNPVEEGLQLKAGTHSAQFEISQPQFSVRKSGFLSEGI
jgi:hypothetical protein